MGILVKVNLPCEYSSSHKGEGVQGGGGTKAGTVVGNGREEDKVIVDTVASQCRVLCTGKMVGQGLSEELVLCYLHFFVKFCTFDIFTFHFPLPSLSTPFDIFPTWRDVYMKFRCGNW